METNNREIIKELREKTGASILLIKKALTQADGDRDRAVAILTSLGNEIAAKKEARQTFAGRIDTYLHPGARIGVIIELRSETDFVSRNDDFKTLAHDIAMHVAAMAPSHIEELYSQPFIKDESQTVGDIVKKASALFGEHIEVARFARLEL